MTSATSKPKHSSRLSTRTNVEGDLKSNYLDEYASSEGSHEFLQTTHPRRSHSLGNLEDTERASGGDVTEDNIFWDCKCAYDTEKINNVYSEGLQDSEMKLYRCHDHSAEEPLNHFNESDHQGYLSSAGTNKQNVEDHYDDANMQSSDDVLSREISLNMHPSLSKSQSLSSLKINTAYAVDGTVDFKSVGFPKSRSVGNLVSMKYNSVPSVDYHEASYSTLELNRNELEKQGSVCHEEFDEYYPLSDSTAGSNEHLHQKRGAEYLGKYECDQLARTEGFASHYVSGEERGKEICYEISKEDQCDSGSDSPRHKGKSLSWMPPDTDDADNVKKFPEEDSFVEYASQLTNKEFSIKRIHEWISQIDIQSDNIVEEVGESSKSFHVNHPKKPTALLANKRPDARSNLGMEVAYNYISALNPASSSARMANMGLFAIPSLSAFVGLKVLNLSGNSIVRVTAGSLPKGLHVLNFSKNSIPSIEGLRELARLRILDLSYNRISRIGHGLSACSSLRELYLAGNKISEVEGLHRLLKLNILDLSSNKIATSKGLGQLAANYASLQVISLEGNPAQKNIGDEQLKKCLLNILPNLVSYNKKVIRASGSKEVSVNRTTRSHSSHLSDRNLRPENRRSRRTSVSTSSHKSSLSRVQSGNGLASLLKSSKSRHRRPVPPVVSKEADQVSKVGLKLPSFPTSSLMRRIRSEGTLLASF